MKLTDVIQIQRKNPYTGVSELFKVTVEQVLKLPGAYHPEAVMGLVSKVLVAQDERLAQLLLDAQLLAARLKDMEESRSPSRSNPPPGDTW